MTARLVRKSLHRLITEAAADRGLPVSVSVIDGRLVYRLGDSTWLTPGDAADRLGLEWW